MTTAIKSRVYRKTQTEKGKALPAYAFPGGFPIVYESDDLSYFCSKCATNAVELEIVINDAFILETDVCESEVCEECGEEIGGTAFDSKKPLPRIPGDYHPPSWLPVVHPHGEVAA